MRMKQYLRDNPDISVEEFAKKAKVSKSCVHNLVNGMTVSRYKKAKAISVATGGKVSIEELCESSR